MNSEQLDLLNKYLDDRLTTAEAETLQSLLRDSAEARKHLRSLATIDAKLTDLAAGSVGPVAAPNSVDTRRHFATRKISATWRSLSGLALGLLIGALFSTVAWAYATPQWLVSIRKPTPVLMESFESPVAPLAAGLPREAGIWSGDFTSVTGFDQGVEPANGTKMLRVLRADYEGKSNSSDSYCGDVFRLIDLRPFHAQLAEGNAVLEVSLAFNASEFPESEQYFGLLAMHAITAELAAQPASLSGEVLTNGSLAMARQSCPRIDRDVFTWQRIEGSLHLPAETDFLLIHLGVSHIPKFQRRVTFAGHYIDDVKISLTQRK